MRPQTIIDQLQSNGTLRMRKRDMTIKTSKCCPGRLERTIRPISYRVILETYNLTQSQL